MEQPGGTIFVSIPSLLDASVAPPGCHVMHVFTPDWVDNWTVRSVIVDTHRHGRLTDCWLAMRAPGR